jgi:hypothetical protein
MRSLCSLIVVCQLDIDNVRVVSPTALPLAHHTLTQVHGYVPAHIAQCRPQLLQLINTNPRLTRLTIYSDLLNGLVPSVFEGLRELEIWGPRNEHLRELDRLLPRASALEGLALVEITQCQDVMPLLARHARAFARLTRLKLMSIDPVHSLDTMAALIAFVSAQAQLRWCVPCPAPPRGPRLTRSCRLDIDLPGLGRAQLFDLLAGLARVQSLEVLGFDCRATIELEDLQEIADVLPRALVALHLQLGFENVPFSDSAMRGLVACLRAMPALTLLHLQTMYATHRDGADELADALPALRTVGFGPALWDVEHADGLATLRRWTFREVALRSAETLGVAGEWCVRTATHRSALLTSVQAPAVPQPARGRRRVTWARHVLRTLHVCARVALPPSLNGRSDADTILGLHLYRGCRRSQNMRKGRRSRPAGTWVPWTGSGHMTTIYNLCTGDSCRSQHHAMCMLGSSRFIVCVRGGEDELASVLGARRDLAREGLGVGRHPVLHRGLGEDVAPGGVLDRPDPESREYQRARQPHARLRERLAGARAPAEAEGELARVGLGRRPEEALGPEDFRVRVHVGRVQHRPDVRHDHRTRGEVVARVLVVLREAVRHPCGRASEPVRSAGAGETDRGARRASSGRPP